MQKKYNPKQTVEKILAISGELFLTKGYDKTSMQDIVNGLGMSKGAIFHHFRSKEEIFEAVVKRMTDEQLDMFKNMISNELQNLSGKEKLQKIFSASLSVNENIVAKILMPQIQEPRVIIEMARFSVNISAPLIADIIREGIEDGSLTTKYPDECAEVVLLLLNTWCDPMIFECDMPTLRKRLKYLQYLMSVSGVDILTDELIEKSIEFTEKLYEVKNGNN